MAYTEETYTAAATWTTAQLADLFRDAFIDAGLMTAWYDSFANGGIENRVLEITYGGTNTHGKTYYWFMFSADGVRLHAATGWNAATDQPTGTQYLDFFATTTSDTVELVRYTSGVDADQSWFVIKSSGSPSMAISFGSTSEPSGPIIPTTGQIWPLGTPGF